MPAPEALAPALTLTPARGVRYCSTALVAVVLASQKRPTTVVGLLIMDAQVT